MISKLKLVLIVLFGFIYQSTWAQDAENRVHISKKNVIKLDILYPAIGYDRLLWQKGRHKMGAFVGFSTHRESFAGYNDPNDGYVIPAVQTRFYLFNMGFYHLYGKKNHYLETGILYSWSRSLTVNDFWVQGKNTPNGYWVGGASFRDANDALFNSPEVQQKIAEKADFLDYGYKYDAYYNHRLSLRIGYRYQRKDGGFFFRGGLSVANFIWSSYDPTVRFALMGGVMQEPLYYPYLSVGWSF